jgi:hypothetical protein
MIDYLDKHLRKLTEKQALIVLVCLALLVLVLPTLIRLFFFDGIMVGSESYYHLRMTSLLQNQESISVDPLLSGNRYYLLNPYHYFLAFFGTFVSLEVLSVVFPVLFGLGTVILFYFTLKEFIKNLQTRFLIVLFFVLSPIFVYVFSHQQSTTFFLSLSVLGFFFFTRKGKWPVIGAILLAFMPFFGILHTLFVLTLISIYVSTHRKKIVYLFVYFFLLAIVIGIVLNNYNILFFQRSFFQNLGIIEQTFSDLGSWYGFSLFLLILSSIGLIKSWVKKYDHVLMYLLILIAFIFSSFFDLTYNIYSNFFLCIYAGFGFISLWRMKWGLSQLKKMSLFLLILGLLFSATSTISRVSHYGPSDEMLMSLEWMNENLPEEGVIVTSPEYAYWVHYYAQKKTLVDPEFSQTLRGRAILKDMNVLFDIRRENKAMQFIDKYKIQYFLITPEMKESLVWQREDQGLLFLLENSENFKKLYQDQGIEVWQVLELKSSQ